MSDEPTLGYAQVVGFSRTPRCLRCGADVGPTEPVDATFVRLRNIAAMLPRCGTVLGDDGYLPESEVTSHARPSCGRKATRFAGGVDCAVFYCDEHAAEWCHDLPYAGALRGLEAK